jgi:hypothetical protein
MSRFQRVGLMILPSIGTLAYALDTPPSQIPVQLTDDKGSFSGQLSMSLTGSLNNANVAWDATIVNTSSRKIFRVAFCVKAVDSAGQEIKPGGDECVLRLWGTNWAPGAPLKFKGHQRVKISEQKVQVSVSKYTISISEIFDQPPNLRMFDTRCTIVWASAIRVFADKKFRPTVMDKDSFTATFAYDGGRIDGYTSRDMLKAYTSANTRFMGPIWESFRIDSASLYLREEGPGTCTVEVKMAFAGYGQPLFGNYGWYALDSNFNFEKALLDDLQARARQAGEADLDRGIKQISEAPAPAANAPQPQLAITSEPSGAEIEINGEFIGNTPTTVTAKEGSVTVVVKKAGYQPWQRTLKLSSGDKRTLQADLIK